MATDVYINYEGHVINADHPVPVEIQGGDVGVDEDALAEAIGDDLRAGDALPNSVDAVTAAKLVKGATTREVVTCTNANSDYAAAGGMPAGTKTLEVYCASSCIVTMGEATSTTKGRYVGPSSPTLFPVTVTGTAADDTVHAQSATAGATVSLTYLPS